MSGNGCRQYASALSCWSCQVFPTASRRSSGDDLFTSLRFRTTPRKVQRTTNALEGITGEFRRRTQTHASLQKQEAVFLLLLVCCTAVR
jgi:transposase-like protein